MFYILIAAKPGQAFGLDLPCHHYFEFLMLGIMLKALRKLHLAYQPDTMFNSSAASEIMFRKKCS